MNPPATIALAVALSFNLAMADTSTVSSPIVRVDGSPSVSANLRGACTEVRLDRRLARALRGQDGVLIEHFPLTQTEEATISAFRLHPFAPDATLVLSSVDAKGNVVNRTAPLPEIDCFAGFVNGDPESRFFLSIGERVCMGYVQIGGRTLVLSQGPIPAPESAPLLISDLDALPDGTINWRPWSCDSADLVTPPASEGSLAGAQPCRQVKIAIETDWEYFQLFQGDTLATAEYTATLFAATQDVYIASVNAKPWMSMLRLWTVANDPWSASSTTGELYAFHDYWLANMSGTIRNLAHFLSGRTLGGGVAWLNAICSPNEGFGLSANLSGFFPYPLIHNNSQNWDIMVFAHELGHNFGAPHTHNYDPPADGCGLSPADCTVATAGQGTIMSYCHLCTGGMANMRMEFHAASIASIEAFLPGVSCTILGTPAPPAAVPDWSTVNQGITVDIDVLANDARGSCDPVSINTFPATTIHGATMTRLVGAGPEGRDLIRYQAPTTWYGMDTFSYVARDSGGALASALVSVWISPMAPPSNPFGDSAGVAVKYYDLTAPTVLPDFSTLTSFLSATTAQVNFASTNGAFAGSGRNNNVGAHFSGWVNVPSGGAYTLYTESNEGTRLWIDGTLVVDNDGIHAMLEKSGVKELAAGKHAFVLGFFEATGAAGCIMRIEGGGLAKQVVPASMLTYGGSLLQGDFDANGAVDGADLAVFLGRWASTDALADMNDDGIVDGADLTLLMSAWTG